MNKIKIIKLTIFFLGLGDLNNIIGMEKNLEENKNQNNKNFHINNLHHYYSEKTALNNDDSIMERGIDNPMANYFNGSDGLKNKNPLEFKKNDFIKKSVDDLEKDSSAKKRKRTDNSQQQTIIKPSQMLPLINNFFLKVQPDYYMEKLSTMFYSDLYNNQLPDFKKNYKKHFSILKRNFSELITLYCTISFINKILVNENLNNIIKFLQEYIKDLLKNINTINGEIVRNLINYITPYYILTNTKKDEYPFDINEYDINEIINDLSNSPYKYSDIKSFIPDNKKYFIENFEAIESVVDQLKCNQLLSNENILDILNIFKKIDLNTNEYNNKIVDEYTKLKKKIIEKEKNIKKKLKLQNPITVECIKYKMEEITDYNTINETSTIMDVNEINDNNDAKNQFIEPKKLLSIHPLKKENNFFDIFNKKYKDCDNLSLQNRRNLSINQIKDIKRVSSMGGSHQTYEMTDGTKVTKVIFHGRNRERSKDVQLKIKAKSSMSREQSREKFFELKNFELKNSIKSDLSTINIINKK
jgi:hypothetical protein